MMYKVCKGPDSATFPNCKIKTNKAIIHKAYLRPILLRTVVRKIIALHSEN